MILSTEKEERERKGKGRKTGKERKTKGGRGREGGGKWKGEGQGGGRDARQVSGCLRWGWVGSTIESLSELRLAVRTHPTVFTR